jgi:hypothetical protein
VSRDGVNALFCNARPAVRAAALLLDRKAGSTFKMTMKIIAIVAIIAHQCHSDSQVPLDPNVPMRLEESRHEKPRCLVA